MATLEMLAVATSKMRRLQKDYFRRRTNTLLNEAKAAEAEVDRLLRELAPSNVAIAVDLFEADQGKHHEHPGRSVPAGSEPATTAPG